MEVGFTVGAALVCCVAGLTVLILIDGGNRMKTADHRARINRGLPHKFSLVMAQLERMLYGDDLARPVRRHLVVSLPRTKKDIGRPLTH